MATQNEALRNGRHAEADAIRYNDGLEQNVDSSDVLKQDKRKKKRTKPQLDSYIPRARLGPHRRPICLVPTSESFKTFERMFTDESFQKCAVFLFHDTIHEWEQFGLDSTVKRFAGAGNARARSYQHIGQSIGIPMAFRSLEETRRVRLSKEHLGGMASSHTSREIIDEAFKRIVDLFLSDHEKDTLYYSVDRNNPSGVRIDVPIFAGVVGADVVDYICNLIQAVPGMVFRKRSGI